MKNTFPPQIKYIIGNEAAERFSFYGMRSILTVFMTHSLLMPESVAKGTYHFFVSACYLTPLVGAWISDRIWGKYKTILYLSLFYCLGHAALAAWENKMGLYIGLVIIAMGAGGIKPCVSAHVGDQFTVANRDLVQKVFDIFYFSVNFGSFFATLAIPYLYAKYSPALAFGLPGVLMAVSTVIFWIGRKYYHHVPPTRETGAAGFLPVVWYAMTHQGQRKPGQSCLDAALGKYTAQDVEGVKAAVGIFKVFFTVTAFWAMFDQHGSSWVLQAEKMDLNVLGYKFEASQISALNPILVMIMIPIFSLGLYPLIERLGVKVTPLRKMSAGMVVSALSFIAMGFFQGMLDGGYQLSVAWQFIPYILLTAGEILVSITGLEFAYSQAPRSMKSTIMSFWFLTIFAGNFLTGWISEVNAFTGASYFYFFAVLTLVLSGVFMFSASRYKGREYFEAVA
jgi:POT family proton-dependent oligopeptide transporter